jgi:phage tail-like protein
MIGLNDVVSSQSMPSFLQAYLSRDADITFNFTILIGGLPWGDFYSVETFTRQTEVHTYKELGKNDNVHELIGQGSYGHVVLKWGLMNRSALWGWMDDVKVKKDFRKDVLIMQMNRGKIPIRIFTLTGAWPIRWTGANLDAMSSTTAVEELELSFRELDVTAIPLPF